MHKLAENQTIENNSLEVAIEALAKSIARWTDKPDRIMTAIPGLSLFRRDEPTQPSSAMYEPSICLTTQGAKRVLLGDDTYVYDRHNIFNHVRGSAHSCADHQSKPGEALPGAHLET